MRKFLFVFALVAWLVTACATAAPVPLGSTPEAQSGNTPSPQVTGAPSQEPTVETGFTPSDPATVKLAAGKPQLVEFFAFW